MLKHVGCEDIAYAAYVVFTISAIFMDSVRHGMQLVVNSTSGCIFDCGLRINSKKMEVVLFNRKPRRISTTEIEHYLKAEAYYLGFLLHRNLYWKSNTIKRAKNVSIALYICNKATGKHGICDLEWLIGNWTVSWIKSWSRKDLWRDLTVRSINCMVPQFFWNRLK